MTFRHLIMCTLFCLPAFQSTFAQDEATDSKTTPYNRLYWGSNSDAAVFSTALVQHLGKSEKLTTLRFSYINFGFSLHFDFNQYVGLLSGANIKNIGFIEKFADSTVKRRVYTIGAPLGIKLGKLHAKNFVFFGGGVDVPFNYREKGFVHRGDKEKFNEWFSERTPAFLPYFFAGVSANPGFTVKLQYYPGNFMNPDFSMPMPGHDNHMFQPYLGYKKSNLILLSLGMDLYHGKHKKETNKKTTLTM